MIKAFIAKHAVVLFFGLSLLLGYGRWAMTGSPTWFIWGMMLSGFALTYIADGRDGVLAQLKSAIHVRQPPTQYLLVIGILAGCNLFALGSAWLLFGDLPSLALIRTEPQLLPVFLALILMGGPIAEEFFGLRGFALPRLLRRFSPLVCSLLIGAFFGGWHLVEFLRVGSSQYAIGLAWFPLFIAEEIAASIIMTWFYPKNRGSLFLSGIFFHLMMNFLAVTLQSDVTSATIANFPPMNIHYVILYGVALALVASFLTVRGRLYRRRGPDELPKVLAGS